jgi:hypothetical protein
MASEQQRARIFIKPIFKARVSMYEYEKELVVVMKVVETWKPQENMTIPCYRDGRM